MTKKEYASYKWKHIHRKKHPIRWLPVHYRFFTPFLKFGQVKGVSRLFLELEISLSLLVVAGTMLLAILRIGTLFAR